MAVLKCKMCGGELTVEEGSSVAVCEYCGSKQTVPKADDEKKMKLFDRANRLRFNCEFDKAGEVYENIIEEFPEEAEAYWGNLLCKYGIEYVDDPATGDKVPTCHRSSFDGFMGDPDFEMVMENADTLSRAVYREQAKQIEEIRKGIIEVSGKEEPYDIFICYKETAEDGQRTIDSVIAQDVYDALIDKGYRVFFSRISLEDKLGTEYEPYIFAALNSAKVMLAFGTSYDYYNAVWVKNEWSRFLKLIAKDKTKALIPCYKDIDAYDMPKEFAKLQAQDMGKVGAVQDLLRGIDKISGRTQRNTAAPGQTVVQQTVSGPNVTALIDRGNMALEDGKPADAKTYFDQVLSMDARSAEAYLGMFMAEIGAKNRPHAAGKFISGDYLNNRNWQRAKQFAAGAFLEELTDWEKKRENLLKAAAEEGQRKKREEEQRLERFRKEKEDFLQQYQKGTLVYPPEIQKKFDTQKTEADELEQEMEDEEDRQKLKELESRREERRKYLSTLGLFNGKEKKEVRSEMDSLNGQIEIIQQKIREKENRAVEARRSFIMEKAKYYGVLEPQIKYHKPGETVTFGMYGTGRVPIEWIVLSATEDKALLLSKYALDIKQYHERFQDITWEECTLRSWLNQTLYSEAFNAGEQRLIMETTVTAEINPKYYTDPGNNTKDKVFLLSIGEVNKYFLKNETRKCVPMTYAGAYTDDENKTESGEATCCWWLRSPGHDQGHAACVARDGTVRYTGDYIHYADGAVRPALWIDLKL